MFLTEIDPRAAVKGSRDPLGFMTLWAHFGRHVVGNLTTQATTVRGFTTLLLGYYLAERVQAERDAEASTLDVFLRFEQLAGYCRFAINRDGQIRGIERVRKRLGEGARVPIGLDRDCQVLSDQKTYGLWGLYTESARASGLLDPADRRPTPDTREFLERAYVRTAWQNDAAMLNGLLRLLGARSRRWVYPDSREAELCSAVAHALRPKFTTAEREFYRDSLVFGGPADPTHGKQRLLAGLLAQMPADVAMDIGLLRELTHSANNLGQRGQELAARLDEIRVLEQVIAPAAFAFEFIQARDGKAIDSVAGAIRDAWGPGLSHIDVHPVIALKPHFVKVTGTDESADRLIDIAKALAAGEYAGLIRLLVEHNAAVMQARDGSQPWIEIDGYRLDVRLADESGTLPPREKLPTIWRHSYFIEALRSVQAELNEQAH